jgi:basic membrane protein A and related proteins
VSSKFLRLLLLCCLSLTLVVAGCGDDEEEGTGGGETTAEQTATAEPEKKIKVGMVTDIGGLNDRSFNAAAYEGLKRAESELGAEIRAVTSNSNADYVPNLTSLVRQKYDLIVGVGFLMAEAMAKVAKSFPDQQFALIDFPQEALKGKPANVKGLIFKEQQAGYLAGIVAASYVKDKGGDQVISSVGGQKIPPVDAYIAGYKAGAESVVPDIEVLNAYSQDFVDQAKCKEIALDQIDKGSQVVFQVAGQCGLGALDAAKEKSVQGIGVDVDQSFLGPHILTSAEKKIVNAVFATAEEVQGGSFQGGTTTVFDATNDGIGLGKLNEEGAKYQDAVDAALEKMKAGELDDIPNTVK